jgi:hypothetical protein
MPGEEQAWGAARLRGKPEAPRHDRCLHLDLAESCGESAGFQPFFQGPGRVHPIARLNDEDKRWVETEGDKPRAVRRAPFARGSVGQAPEERRGILPPRQAIADEGKRKGKRRRRVAIGGRLDLMQAVGGKPVPRNLAPCVSAIPPPRGEVRRRFAASGWGDFFDAGIFTPPGSAFSRATLSIKGREEGGNAGKESLRSKKGAGGAGQRSRIRRGGEGQRHGNLFEHANTLTQLLDETFAACPACSLNARRQKLTDVFAVWNVVTHGYKLRISFLFCS